MEILTLEGIYTGMTDKASGNKEITQKEMGKESGQRKPAMRKKRHKDKSVILIYLGHVSRSSLLCIFFKFLHSVSLLESDLKSKNRIG